MKKKITTIYEFEVGIYSLAKKNEKKMLVHLTNHICNTLENKIIQ